MIITNPQSIPTTSSNDDEFSVVELENTYEKDKPHLTRHRPGLYPSEASVEYMDGTRKIVLGHCLRGAWYRAMNVQKIKGVNIGLGMKAHLGKWDEKGVIQRWKEMGIWVDNNIKFFTERLVLSGELDAILKKANGKLMGVEIKTFYGYPANRSICGVQREKGTGKFYAGRPKDEHFLQAALYAWEYQDILDEYRIYYLERGDGHRVEFRVLFHNNPDGTHQCCWEQVPGPYWNAYKPGIVTQPYTIEDVHARYQMLVTFLRAKQLPPKDFDKVYDAVTVEYLHNQGEISKTDYDKWVANPSKNKLGSWRCSYCEYSDQCMQDDLTA